MIDAAAVRSLADLYRREQSAGHCLDPDQVATTAVTHLLALGYRRPATRPDLISAPTPDLPLRDSGTPELGSGTPELGSGATTPADEHPITPPRPGSSMELGDADRRTRAVPTAPGTDAVPRPDPAPGTGPAPRPALAPWRPPRGDHQVPAPRR